MKDESERYTEENALELDLEWILQGGCRRLAEFAIKRMKPLGLKSVLEFGCGTGIAAGILVKEFLGLDYYGIDKSDVLLAIAERKHKNNSAKLWFELGDVRDFRKDCELVIAFSLFKHVPLLEGDEVCDVEWQETVGGAIRCGKYACFNMQLLSEDKDNGVDYPHVFVTEVRLAETLKLAGHEELEREVWNEGPPKDIVVWTRSSTLK